MDDNRIGVLVAGVLCRAMEYWHASKDVQQHVAQGMRGEPLDCWYAYLLKCENKLGAAIGQLITETKDLK